ncbi:MAG: FHA domain-containing protein [Solirubrobacteraceae bacterium]
MNRQALSSNRAGQLWRVRAHAADRDTRQLTSRHPVPVDAYTLLDHRTRESAVLQAVAPPGRYLAVEHDGRRWLISLSRPITHIGRGLIADVRLEDPHVSRRHAIIAIRGDGPDAVRVLDDRSSGGTFVNGDEVTVANLHDGDIVRIGRVAFRYTEIAAALKRSRRPRRIPLVVRRPGRTGAVAAG